MTMSSSTSDYHHSHPTTWPQGKSLALQKAIVPLSSNSHKGSSGRIAILGGNAQYTGAPYYASMACLHSGADLAYVLTAHEATLPLKCYSPELMVTSIYKAHEFDDIVKNYRQECSTNNNDDTNHDSDLDWDHCPPAQDAINSLIDKAIPLLERAHCLIVGPGLGRCPLVQEAIAKLLTKIIQNQRPLPLVLDADALYLLSLPRYRHILQDYPHVVLTPNVVEYQRLLSSNDKDDDKLSVDAFDHMWIVKKGKDDVIGQGNYQKQYTKDDSNTSNLWFCQEKGGLKRSGGIGDILSGTLGTLVAWHYILNERRDNEEEEETKESSSSSNTADLGLACWTACCFVKRATEAAFTSKGRAMTAPDILDELGPTVVSMTSDEVDD